MQANQIEATNRLLSTLLRLEKRLRLAESADAVRFIALNDTLGILSYEQGAIGTVRKGVSRLSGLSEPDLNAPYIAYLNRVLKWIRKGNTVQYLTATDLPDRLEHDWAEWLPGNLVALKVADEWLLLARPKPFTDSERSLLEEWRALVDFHLSRKKQRSWRVPSWLEVLRAPLLWVSFAVIASFMVPVKLTVLAPAEVVARNPALLRAPLDAVISEVLVEPDAFVEAGDLLMRFDDRNLKNQLALAQQRILTAQAAYRQSAQQALVDIEAKNRLMILQTDIEAAQLEVDHLTELLKRTELRAPFAGQILMAQKQEWLGRPVNLGERLAQLADPTQIELKAWLSPRDQVPLEPESPLTLFDNSRPDTELAGRFVSMGYQVEERPDGSYAFPVKGSLDASAYQPPIGSRGTVRLESDEVSLAYLLMRRPLALLRQWLGV